MVSDGELVERLREFLRSSDLSTTTTAIVRRKLEEDFGIDLSDKKVFIREQVDLFLHSELSDLREEEEAAAAGGPEQSQEERDEEEANEGYGDNRVSEEEESDNGEEESSNPSKNGSASRKRKLNKTDNKEVKKRGGGFTKLCNLSPSLQDFVGESKLARTEVVKKIWAYIRENNLQDPKNRRNIICDERLHSLFNVNTIDMFQMNKALSKHIWPLDSEDGSETTAKPKPKDKQPKKEKGKQQKRGSTGLLAPLQLSEDLIKFIGTGENTLSRPDVIKRMWDYIKQNDLQDPADKRNIICDEKLKELFKVDSFHGFTVTKLLKTHFVKT